jgi:hypothetical protein
VACGIDQHPVAGLADEAEVDDQRAESRDVGGGEVELIDVAARGASMRGGWVSVSSWRN